MKWSNSKLHCLLAALFLANDCTATALPTDSVLSITDSNTITQYQQRIERRSNMWQNLIPELFILQYAGDIGMLSVGTGWNYGRSKQWETHLLLGYSPGHDPYRHYWTLTLRESYNPWCIHLHKDKYSITPLSVNLSINSIFHGDFWMSEPERYPSGYYGFSSRMRFHLGLGQRFNIRIPENKRFLHSQFSIYYEISTCDLYLRQKFLNSSIPLKDIIAIGIGIIYTL